MTNEHKSIDYSHYSGPRLPEDEIPFAYGEKVLNIIVTYEHKSIDCSHHSRPRLREDEIPLINEHIFTLLAPWLLLF